MIMRLSNMRVREGFTLAEVLITLGIIGVVAAMTMPTLMNSTQGAQYKAAYKKALSAISQAVTLNVALDDWNLADSTAASTCAYPSNSIAALFNSRMNIVRCEPGAFKGSDGKTDYAVSGKAGGIGGTAATTTGTADNITLFFNDGIMFTFPANNTACTKDDTKSGGPCYGFIDVNGVKAPNKFVKCDNSGATGDNCQSKSPTDVYPVVFYDQTILPSSVAARAVLYAK